MRSWAWCSQLLYTILPLFAMGVIIVLWFLGYWIVLWRYLRTARTSTRRLSLASPKAAPDDTSAKSQDAASPRASAPLSKPKRVPTATVLSVEAFKRELRQSHVNGALMSMTVLWIGLHPSLCFQVRLFTIARQESGCWQ